MAKYHINPNSGAVGTCRAENGHCPFGAPEEHFDSPAAARKAYELKMSSRPLDRGTLKSRTADELRAILLKESGEVGLDVAIIEKAALFAKELHKGQYRSAPPWEERPPYIVHPYRNAIRVIRWGKKGLPAVLGAILHDTVEDSSEKYCDDRGIPYSNPIHAREILLKKIRRDYGPRVAEIVLKLSNPYQSQEERNAMSIEAKNDSYVSNVREEIRDDEDVLVDKLSDLHDNAAGLYHTAFPGREKQTKKQALKYSLTMPVFRDELNRNPPKDPVLRRNLYESIVLIEDRLNAILNPQKD